MGRYYDNSPIREAICEFRFEPSQKWDSTVLGLVYDKLKSDFPKKRQLESMRMDLRGGPEGIGQTLRRPQTHMQFLRDDDRVLVQVGPDFLSVNHLKPYSKWDTFEAMIEQALNAYSQVTAPKGVLRIGLRYINQIELPQETVEIEDLILASPRVPSPVPQVFSAWIQRVEVPFPQDSGVLIVQSGSIRGSQEKPASFLLDIDFITQKPQHIPLDSVKATIKRAHDEVESAFEACVTDKARELFKEVKTP